MFWGLIFSLPLWLLIVFVSCQQVVKSPFITHKEYVAKYDVDTSENTKQIIDYYLNLKD